MLTAFSKQAPVIITEDNNDENNFPMKIGNEEEDFRKQNFTYMNVMSAKVFTYLYLDINVSQAKNIFGFLQT